MLPLLDQQQLHDSAIEVLDAFAVPLDHDPVLRQIDPYIVHVLVARPYI